jgi:hypothetical protein
MRPVLDSGLASLTTVNGQSGNRGAAIEKNRQHRPRVATTIEAMHAQSRGRMASFERHDQIRCGGG